ncbi:retinoblastoma-associated protein [Biomphalaria glabrata]|nr:retinoblastoma-associated protein [Biomphalaria glabrata]
MMNNSVNIMQNITNSVQESAPPLQTEAMRELFYQASLQKYNELCRTEEITADVKQRGETYFQKLLHLDKANNLNMIDERGIFASVLYIAVIESSLPYGDMDPLFVDRPLEPSMTVSEILLKTDVNISQLFLTMEWIKSNISLTGTVNDHLKKLANKYLVVSALFNIFEGRLTSSVFKEENINEGADTEAFLPPLPETEGVSYRKKQCWVLYLLAKKHLLFEDQGLYSNFQLLLCCVELVLRQTPSFLLNEPYDSIRIGCYNNDQTMLQKLAEDFDVDAGQIIVLQQEHTESYFQSLLNEDGELDSESLCHEYLLSYQKEGDINELDFLLKESYIHALTQGGNQQQVQPKLSNEQTTPVRLAVNNIQEFLQHFAHLPDKPNDKLQAYFKKCSTNPSAVIDGKISVLRSKFLQEYQCGGTSEMKFNLAVKLYYKILEMIIQNEASHLPPQSLSTLLNKDNFHASLLACAVEVVLVMYTQSWAQIAQISQEDKYSFPWILEVFSLQAYEFYKVIDSFLKAESKLSQDLVKHLQCLEVKVLESLAWCENSDLFNNFPEHDLGQKTPPSSPMESHDSNRNAVDLFLSPVHPSSSSFNTPSSSLSSIHASPVRKNANIDPGLCEEIGSNLPSQFKSRSLIHFLKRVLRLGFSRLSKLCTDLEISRELQHKIWTCFEHCVTKMPNLMKNRHIDQIIMCCIYSICKVCDNEVKRNSETEIKFKSIVNKYKNLAHAKQEIFKNVYIDDSKSDSVIAFYNTVFTVNMKEYILNFYPNRNVRQQLSPMPKQSPSYCLNGRKNFLISPLKESFKTPSSPGQMTPSTRLLYCFGDTVGSSEKLKGINETVKKFVPTGAKKRLNMDDLEMTSPSKAKKSLL